MHVSLSAVGQNDLVSHETDQDKYKGNTSKLKTIFAPQFTNTNPYQKQLADHLGDLGVQVEGISYRKVFMPTALKPYNAGILHLHWLHTFSQAPNLISSLTRVTKFILGLAILRLQGIKIVWTAHNLKDHENRQLLLDQVCTTAVGKLAHAIITHSQTAKTKVAQELNLSNKDKIWVIPHGNYTNYYPNQIEQAEARKSLGLSDSSIVFLFLGLIRPYKGVFELIEAFEQLNDDRAQLVIAGKTLNEELEQQIRQKIADNSRIKFKPGFVPDEQIQVYMNACDTVIFPYRNVLTSGTAILAMSFGKSCIAPRLGCMGEILSFSGAFLYNAEQEYGLLDSMKQAVQNQKNLSSMGKHNQQLSDQWSWDKVAQKTLQVYQDCLNS